jgi:tripartite-type tricarboxylate transporter receptor subunit TctC
MSACRTAIGPLAILAITFLAIPMAPHAAPAADNYPERPVRLIVPFPAGGINDVLARAWADKITPHLGPVIIENRGGGGSMIGSAEAARAAPDGYTLLLGNSTNQVLNPQLMHSPPFDPGKDFVAVTILTKIPNAMAVHPSLPVHTLKELADYARANAGKLSYGSAGVGTMTHLSAELFKKLAGGLDIVHVPYRGGAPGIADITGGTVPVASLSMAAQLLALHRAGKIRIICVNAAARVEAAPEIPTAVESGFPGMVVEVFNGIFVPAGTPRPIVNRIADATRKIMTDPELQKILKGAGADVVVDSGPDKAAQLVTAERERWTPIIEASGIEKR